MLVCSFLVQSKAEDGPDSSISDELDWLFTLAVHKDSKNFAFSLMMEGWLSFDTWGDEVEYQADRIEISGDDFKKLREAFGGLFRKMQYAKAVDNKETPFYTFERIDEKVTTIEFWGDHPKVVAFINELSRTYEKTLPFDLIE